MLFRELETERTYLKNISAADREFLYRHFSHAAVNTYLFDAEPPANLNEADAIIALYTAPEPRTLHRWILARKEDGVKLGTCGFHCWEKTESCCDVGYDLFPEYWGNGYMHEALREILRFARTDMSIKKIHACIYPDNHASIRLAEKNGFIFSGAMKDEIFRGKRYPHMMFTLDCI